MSRGYASANKGQSLVEWAFVLPLLVLFIVIIMDFGRVVYYYSAIHNSAREGARYGVINPDQTTEIQDAARSKAVGLDQSELNIFVTQPTDKTINVRVTYRFFLITPLMGTFVGSNNMMLNAQTTMYIEK
jgi:Flp pilus assembly protein TadG